MSVSIGREVLASRGLTVDQAALDEIERLHAEGQLGEGYKTEPRCHVCCEVESRDLVNRLIAAGLTNRQIAESCGYINARRKDAGDDRMIGGRNVWAHRREHFNLDRPRQAFLREIAERRAAEDNRDYVNGVGHAVTPYAVLESAMVLGYQHFTQEEAEPPTVKETMEAATKLHELTRRDASQRQMADLMFSMQRIIDAAQEFVPADQHEAFLARVEGKEAPQKAIGKVIEHVHQVAQKAVKQFTPKADMDERDAI